MAFWETFCSSPWIHARIDATGDLTPCRWAQGKSLGSTHNIRDTDPREFFQDSMAPLRHQLLQGQRPSLCSNCQIMEQHGKVSGRQRQLLKIGVTPRDFEKTMLSSPWIQQLTSTHQQQGHTTQMPQDWQIDLGNYCNSACVFCDPQHSSKIATEFHRMGIIENLPPRAWCDDPLLLERFIDTLKQCPHIQYLHFIGGETLITPAFKTILRSLIDHGISQEITLGFTTNLTVWDPSIVDLLARFQQVNVGMSVECLHPVNDYLRYGSDLSRVQQYLESWAQVSQRHGWLMQIRTTPTIFSIGHLDTVYRYAAQHAMTVESCNFLHDPAFMRPTVLPQDLRQQAILRLQRVVQELGTSGPLIPVINVRDTTQHRAQLAQDASSYVDYLQNQPDESHRLTDLVRYIRQLESSRGNCILDYLPEYEQLLRSAGY